MSRIRVRQTSALSSQATSSVPVIVQTPAGTRVRSATWTQRALRRARAPLSVAAVAMLSLTATSFQVQAADANPATNQVAASAEHRHGEHGGHEHGMMAPGPMRDRMLKRLESAIKPRADQQAAWATFVEAAKRETPPGSHEQAMKEMAALSAPDRLDHMAKMSEQHQQSMRRMADEMRKLYAVLSPEQRQAADQATVPPMHQRMGKWRERHQHDAGSTSEKG